MSDSKVTPADHSTAAGDHLARVAATYRFRSYGPLWNDPANADLRSRRHNPNILAVGDPVHVPEQNDQEVDRATEQRHRFKAEVHPLVLRLALESWNGKPLEEKPTEVLLDGKPAALSGGAPGTVEFPIEAFSDRCRIVLKEREIVARIGHLQPSDTVAGVRQRLNNLGYLAGDTDDATTLQFRSAVEEFQCDHHLEVDGRVGPHTRAALVKAHGC